MIENGGHWAFIDTVVNATILSTDIIQFSSYSNGQIFLTATIERMGDRIHVIKSIGADSQIYYINAIEVATGKLSMVYEYCDDEIYNQ